MSSKLVHRNAAELQSRAPLLKLKLFIARRRLLIPDHQAFAKVRRDSRRETFAKQRQKRIDDVRNERLLRNDGAGFVDMTAGPLGFAGLTEDAAWAD